MATTGTSGAFEEYLENHTLTAPYFHGYLTAKQLDADVESVVIRPYGPERDEFVFYRNHHVRARVEGDTKIIETPTYLLGQHLYKLHDAMSQDDRFGFDVSFEFDVPGDTLYERTGAALRDDVASFFEALQPAGDVVMCRPEEFLSFLLSDVFGHDGDYVDRFTRSSSRFLRRLDDDITWEDAYESAGDTHPKFAEMDRMVATIRDDVGVELASATALSGLLRGYRLPVDGQQVTLLCRGWGRDMGYAMASTLCEYDVSSLVFLGGSGGLRDDADINDLILPTASSAPGESWIDIDNAFCRDDRFADADEYVTAPIYNVDSPVDETVEYTARIASSGYAAVEMEVHGVARALADSDVPLGVLLSVMDVPLDGRDLGSTSYDLETKKRLVKEGNMVTIARTAELLGLT